MITSDDLLFAPKQDWRMLLRLFASLAFVALLAACGGGDQSGSGNAPERSETPAPIGGGNSTEPQLPIVKVEYSRFELLKTLEWHEDYVSCVAFTPNGKQFASGSWGYVALWDTSRWTQSRHFEPQYRTLQSIDFSRDGKLMLTAGSDGTVKVWNPNLLDEPLIVMDGYDVYWPEDAKFSPDATMVAICSSELIDMRSVASGKVIWQAKNADDVIVYGVAFSPDGSLLASACAGDGHHVKIWDVKSGKLIRKLVGHDYNVGSVAFSPDGKRIASAGADNTVRIWNAETYEQLHVLRGHTELVCDIAFSPDGLYIASAGYDRVVRVWNVAEGAEVCALVGHDERVMSVAFSPDGKHLASGGVDKTVRIWGVPE